MSSSNRYSSSSDDDNGAADEYTIHDLDHAPPPPDDRWRLRERTGSFRGSLDAAAVSLSPRVGAHHHRTTLSIPGDCEIRSTSRRGDFSSSRSFEPPGSPLRSALRTWKKSHAAAHRRTRSGTHSPTTTGSLATASSGGGGGSGGGSLLSEKPAPLRGRAHSQPTAGSSYYDQDEETPYWYDDMGLSHGKSFPPDDRKVNFAESRDAHHQTGMLFIPEEEKEAERSDELLFGRYDSIDDSVTRNEIALTGTEIDNNQQQQHLQHNVDAIENGNRKRTRSDLSKRTTDSDLLYSDTEYDDTGDDEDVSADNDSIAAGLQQQQQQQLNKRVRFLGLPMPRYFAKRRPSWNRVAIFVVEKAPCFFCRPMQTSTYRSVLVRLNILLALFALGQISAALGLYIVMQAPNLVDRSLTTITQSEVDNQSNIEVLTNAWNLNGSIWFLGLLGLILLVSILLTIRAIQNVSINVFIRFLWLLLWVIPLEVFFMIGLFDYFRVTDVWIKYWWRDRTLAWFRHIYCENDIDGTSTANEECATPEFQTEQETIDWCWENFMSESCLWIRDGAQRQMRRDMLIFYYANGIWAILFVILLFLSVKTLESIISVPLVQKSRESNVPAWLAVPTIGCVVCGMLYSFSSTSVLNTQSDARTETSWIGPLFIAAGGLFFLSAVLAWFLQAFPILNTKDKRRKSITILGLVLMSFMLLVLLTTLFSASILVSISLEEIEIPEAQRGNIACFIDQSGSCTRCEEEENRCPEWSNADVTKILQNQTKASAALAAIFLTYAASNLRHAFNLRSHIMNYQIDYV